MTDLIEMIDEDTPSTPTNAWRKKNEKLFGVIASHCEGEALTIAQSAQEGDGKALFAKFDLLWRSDAPAGMLTFVKTITESKLTDPLKFEVHIAERTTAAQRLADGGMPLPGPFLALCMLIALSHCSALSGLLSMYAIEEAGPQDVTVDKVIVAARQLLQVRPTELDSTVRRREHVLQAKIRELEAVVASTTKSSFVNQVNQKGKGKGDRKQETCFYCEKPGHRAHECRKLTKEFPGLSAPDRAKWEKYMKVRKTEVGLAAASSASNINMKVEDLL